MLTRLLVKSGCNITRLSYLPAILGTGLIQGKNALTLVQRISSPSLTDGLQAPTPSPLWLARRCSSSLTSRDLVGWAHPPHYGNGLFLVEVVRFYEAGLPEPS